MEKTSESSTGSAEDLVKDKVEVIIVASGGSVRQARNRDNPDRLHIGGRSGFGWCRRKP